MKKCRSCGQEFDNNYFFCVFCGKLSDPIDVKKYIPPKVSKEEKEGYQTMLEQMIIVERNQAFDLYCNCDITYQYAKTYTVYKADWNKMKQKLLSEGNMENISLRTTMKNIGDVINENKLEFVANSFQSKFGKSIFDYINIDGTTSGCMGVILIMIVVGSTVVTLG